MSSLDITVHDKLLSFTREITLVSLEIRASFRAGRQTLLSKAAKTESLTRMCMSDNSLVGKGVGGAAGEGPKIWSGHLNGYFEASVADPSGLSLVQAKKEDR
jgi:hypothetical protein